MMTAPPNLSLKITLHWKTEKKKSLEGIQRYPQTKIFL